MRVRALLATLLLGVLVLSCSRKVSPQGGLTVAVPWDLDTLDPHKRNWAGTFALLSHFYEPLVERDAGLSLRPCLAARWSNPDPYTWIFKLTPGVVFRSGRPLEADDVVYSIQRLLSEPGLGISAYVGKIESLKALDPDTVEIRTKRPTAILLNDLRFVLIMPKGQKPARDISQVDGTGPYQPVSWDEGSLTMVRNESHHGRRSTYRDVTFLLGRKPEAAIQELLTGQAQIAQCNARALEAELKDRYEVEIKKQTSLFVKFLFFDRVRETTPYVPGIPNPFRRKEVREAVSLAIDRQELANRLSTYAVPAAQLVPPYVFGYSPDVPRPVHDPARARQLLAEAGYPNGFRVTLHARRFAETAEILQRMLRAVGITVDVVLLSDSEFQERVARGDASFCLTRIGCPTGDADLFLQQVIRSNGPNALGGAGRSIDPELDAAIDRSDEMVDMEVRQKAVQGILGRVSGDYSFLPLYMDQDVYGVSRGLSWQPRIDSYILAAELTK